MKHHLIAALAAGTAALALASTSFAAATDAPPTAHVAYGDLNTATDAGTEKLYARLRAAAAIVCGHADIRDLRAFSAETACVAEAIGAAVQQVAGLRAQELAQL